MKDAIEVKKQVFWPQYAATLAACFTVMGSMASLAWCNSAYTYLASANSHIPHTKQDISMLQLITNAFEILFVPIAFYVSDKYGRKVTMILHNFAGLMAVILLIFGTTRTSLLISRALTGVYCSVEIVVGTYVSEIAHVQVRTRLLQFYSFSFAIAFLKMYIFATMFTYHQIAIMSLIMPACALTLLLWLPESPYFYVMKEREDLARKSLKKLRYNDVTDEINVIKSSLVSTKTEIGFSNFLKDSGVRKAFFTGCFLISVHRMSGTAPISVYSQTILNPGCHPKLTLQISALVIQIFTMLSQFSSMLITKRFGAKTIYIWSMVSSAMFLFILASYFFFGGGYLVNCAFSMCLPLFILIGFLSSCAPGLVGLTHSIILMFFPMEYKRVAMTLVAFVNSLMGFVSMSIFEVFRNKINMESGILLFGLVTMVNTILVLRYVPETSQKQFSEIYEYFGIKTKHDEESKDCILSEKIKILNEKNEINNN